MQKFKEALEQDSWFQTHKDDLITKQDLAWKEIKVYIPNNQRTLVSERAHDAKSAGHFGFVKTHHLVKRQVLVAKNEKGHKRIWCKLLSLRFHEAIAWENPRFITVTS
uniref:Integrase zinc-binding domain-containing protein n=1 Tax=Micrurus lemniscatus lemniscatus TaxID=129467 RepID=A0A2D4HYM8_MICLE